MGHCRSVWASPEITANDIAIKREGGGPGRSLPKEPFMYLVILQGIDDMNDMEVSGVRTDVENLYSCMPRLLDERRRRRLGIDSASPPHRLHSLQCKLCLNAFQDTKVVGARR